MFFVAPNREVYDDGQGASTWPAYGLDEYNRRYELEPAYAADLTKRWQAQNSRLPIGNAIARVTKAVGIAPCPPCQQRQAMLNRIGDRMAGFFKGG
jgi:hypothetical protein